MKKIWAFRVKKGKTEYLIEWDGYPNSKDDSWEPEENIQDMDMLEEYKATASRRDFIVWCTVRRYDMHVVSFLEIP